MAHQQKNSFARNQYIDCFDSKSPGSSIKTVMAATYITSQYTALILFSKKPETKFPQCLLRLARFKGTDKAEFIDNKQIHGNVFHLIRSALSFTNLHLPIASSFSKDSIKRKDTPLIPISVLREAITNALCHRDYSSNSGSVSAAIYDDRLEIWSYGLLPPGLSIDELGDINQSIPRNRRIANALYFHKFFESWGRGIRLIIDGCIEAGHPAPVYTINSGGLLLSIPYRLMANPVVRDSKGEMLTDKQQELILLIEQNEALSTIEIQNKLSFHPSERWVRDTLSKLRELGYVGVKGQTTSRKWFISR